MSFKLRILVVLGLICAALSVAAPAKADPIIPDGVYTLKSDTGAPLSLCYRCVTRTTDWVPEYSGRVWESSAAFNEFHVENLSNGKIRLWNAHTNAYLARCRGCVESNHSHVVDFILGSVSGTTNQFEVERIPGTTRVALKTPYGYVARCRNCARGHDGDQVAAHVQNPAQGAYAQWTFEPVVGRTPSDIQPFEKSPQISVDLPALLSRVHGKNTTSVSTRMAGFSNAYQAGVTSNDHTSGITITPSRRIVTTMSRKGADCGVLMYSDPYHGGGALNAWTSKCILENHPNSIQAVGEIIAVSHRDAETAGAQVSRVNFYRLPTAGRPFQSLGQLGLPDTLGEGIGVAYLATEDRFYLIEGGDAVTGKQANTHRTRGQTRLWRTQPGMSLEDPRTRFELVRAVRAPMSGQGSSLIATRDGRLFMASTLTSHDEKSFGNGSETAAYMAIAASCLDLATYMRDDKIYRDILFYGQVWPPLGGFMPKDVGVTQGECLPNRPSWRFAGGIVPVSNTSIAALWAGRLNYRVVSNFVNQGADADIGDTDFEFSFQEIK